MGRCCGGKNAGKPISRTRLLMGKGVFLGYHSVVQGLMLAPSLVSDRAANLAKFHRQYMKELWDQIDQEDGIKLLPK